MNETIITGRMTKDPVCRETNTGKPVTSFTVAIDRPFLNPDGKRDTDFVPVVVFGKAVETVMNYGYHNCIVLVKGRLQNRNFESKDGVKHTDLELVCSLVEFPNIKTPRYKRDMAESVPATSSDEESLIPPEDIPFGLAHAWDNLD